MARVAVVMTVKNEREVLRSNILFHRHLGVERFYVFPDDDAEGTGESVADLDFVEVSGSMSAARFLGTESHRRLVEESRKLARAVEDSELQHTARQMLNAIVYVLNNFRKHEARRKQPRFYAPTFWDHKSSAASFDGWREGPLIENAHLFPDFGDQVVPPRNWLRKIGWRKVGIPSIATIPGFRATLTAT